MAGMVFKQGGMGGSAVRAFCYTHTPTAETSDGGGSDAISRQIWGQRRIIVIMLNVVVNVINDLADMTPGRRGFAAMQHSQSW